MPTSPSSVSSSSLSSSRSRVDRVVYVLRAFLRFLFVLTNNLYCIPTHGLWMLTLSPLLHFDPQLFWLIEGYFFKNLLLMVAAWGWTAGYRYYEVGEDIGSCYQQECLMMANHQSTADVPSFMAAYQTKGLLINRVMWIMDRMFKFTNFGFVSWVHGDFFIQAGKTTRDSELDRLRDHMNHVYSERKRQWIVLFPEGGFLRKRKETSQRYAKKNNLPELEHVSLPRVGALHTIINTLHPNKMYASDSQGKANGVCHATQRLDPLRWVVDVTIGYPYGEPADLPAIICMLGKPCKVYLYYRLYPIEDVPTDVDTLTDWLYERWYEKEALLNEFYKTGSFPVPVRPHAAVLHQPRAIEFNNWWIAFVHLLFILSTVFHYWLLSWIVYLVWPV